MNHRQLQQSNELQEHEIHFENEEEKSIYVEFYLFFVDGDLATPK